MSSNISLNESISLKLQNLAKILEDLDENSEIKDKNNGEIKDKNHPLVIELKKNWKKLKDSKLNYSYTHRNIIWKELIINNENKEANLEEEEKEEKIYLFRILQQKIDKVTHNLIR